MRSANYLVLFLCCLFAGCSGDSKSADSINLEPAELEKLASWDATSKASAQLTEMLADIMSDIKDEESANAAIPKLKKLAPKIAGVNRAEKSIGDPSKGGQKLVLKNLADAHKKFDESYVPLMKNEELKAIVSQAIDDAYVGNVTE